MSSTTVQIPDINILEMLRVEFSSLCYSCNYFNACVYRDLEKGVTQCELFENDSGIFKRVINNINRQEEASPLAGAKGLCMNCDKVAWCMLPKASTGVWHCAEYE